MKRNSTLKYANGGIIGLGERWTPGNIYDPTPGAAQPSANPSASTFNDAAAGAQKFDILDPGGSDGMSGQTSQNTTDVGPASETVGNVMGTIAGIATGFATGNPGYAGAAKGAVSGLAQGKDGWDVALDAAKGYAFSTVPALGYAYAGYKGLNALSDYAGWSGPSTGVIGTGEPTEAVGSRGYQNGLPGVFGFGDISFSPATNVAARTAAEVQAVENEANRAGYGLPGAPAGSEGISGTQGGGLGANADGNGTGGGPNGGGTGPGANGGEDGGASDGNAWATGGMIGGRPNPPANMPPTLSSLRAQQNPQAQPTNPAQPQQMQAAIQRAMASGKVTPQTLHMGEQMCVAVLQNPELYPNLRNFAIQRGLVKPNGLPPQFDQRVVLAILAAVRQMAGMAPQGVVPPQGMGEGSGGQLFGPGTGTSDDIPARNMKDGGEVKVSNGEYIIPERVVRAKGKDFFDNLIRKYSEVP